MSQNLAPISNPLDTITKQYADDLIAISTTAPTAANAELWVDTAGALVMVSVEDFQALLARVTELERRLL